MDKHADLISDNIEVVPVVVLSQTFPARPSSIPDVRDFVRRCLAQSPLTEEDNREVGETVAHALLEAAGPVRRHQRLLPHLPRSRRGRRAALGCAGQLAGRHRRPGLAAQEPGLGHGGHGRPGRAPTNGDETAFADWMSGVLRREGMTMETAAKQLGVSVKTVSRWVGGTTEPRLRDLRRIRELFGEFPLP